MTKQLQKRRSRVRFNLKKKNRGKLRLSVFRSNRCIYAQIIDDENSCTLVSASSLESEVKSKHSKLNIETAKVVGSLLGKRAKDTKIDEVYFDRGGYIFHGKVKALADAARANGLKF